MIFPHPQLLDTLFVTIGPYGVSGIYFAGVDVEELARAFIALGEKMANSEVRQLFFLLFFFSRRIRKLKQTCGTL